MQDLRVGVIGEAKTKVTADNTAIAHGSGSVPVFATPAMIALMENAALSSVSDLLPNGSSTVGTKITSSHLAATPIGLEVTARSELLEIDGKRLVFKVEAFDSVEKIGEGIHERFVINVDKFVSKTNSKKTKS